jgi:threonine dehydratase
MLITVAQAEEARRNISAVALRTRLVRCNADAPAELYLKLESLQPIGSFKIRGAANVMARTPRRQLELRSAYRVRWKHGAGSGVLRSPHGHSGNYCGSRDSPGD